MREVRLLFVALLSVVLTGCGAMYSEHHPATEIPKGPGMFSGKDGEFVLYSNERRKQTPEDVPGDRTGSTDQSPEDYREFRDFQEFKRWKETGRDTPAYREFQEWREWKAFRAWQQQQRGASGVPGR